MMQGKTHKDTHTLEGNWDLDQNPLAAHRWADTWWQLGQSGLPVTTCTQLLQLLELCAQSETVETALCLVSHEWLSCLETLTTTCSASPSSHILAKLRPQDSTPAGWKSSRLLRATPLDEASGQLTFSMSTSSVS